MRLLILIKIFQYSITDRNAFQVCETLYKEYDAVEDHPECETVEKAECDINRSELYTQFRPSA